MLSHSLSRWALSLSLYLGPWRHRNDELALSQVGSAGILPQIPQSDQSPPWPCTSGRVASLSAAAAAAAPASKNGSKSISSWTAAWEQALESHTTALRRRLPKTFPETTRGPSPEVRGRPPPAPGAQGFRPCPPGPRRERPGASGEGPRDVSGVVWGVVSTGSQVRNYLFMLCRASGPWIRDQKRCSRP